MLKTFKKEKIKRKVPKTDTGNNKQSRLFRVSKFQIFSANLSIPR